MTQDFCAGFKSDYIIQLLRHLPYFETGRNEAVVHFKSHSIDFSAWNANDFWRGDEAVYIMEIYHYEDGLVDAADVLCFAQSLLEDMFRAQDVPKGDVGFYFEELKKAYRNLKLIPCLGRTTIEAENVGERTQDIIRE
ncbi:hypothetical protein HRG_014846 [Hirsutella rhossiliensis]